MGLFDIFGGKKKREAQQGMRDMISAMQEIAENATDEEKAALKEMFGSMRETNQTATDCDEFPNAYGEFGLEKTNPIPTCGIDGSEQYLKQLKTSDGRKIEAERFGSTSAEDVTKGMIDIYSLSAKDEGLGMIYICPYNNKNSNKAPEGFILS